ncbi:AraC-like DNA-binding protein [Chryseobacterium defluvii]|uniref:AraC-like DNA-binding protein n=1 Tax=Chryseobacterium defluvii TaxID=160396 RepID=A0A840KJI8_9FLAO|nr:helix-turn-helix domain-containing protein [Chryseobacterium defluvii]MBB4807834.1 AraC-like DNA-binding protein [Chryseobacterium defluvii]
MISEGEMLEKSVDLLKRKLVARYVYLMLIILGLYSLIFYFIIQDKLFAYYTFIYFCTLSYTWLLLYKSYDIKKVVHLHLMSAPVFASFIMLNLWQYSISSSMWLLPVPLGAYIFLEKKYVYFYTLYVVALIVAVNLLTSVYNFNYFTFKDKNQLRISDTFVFVANIIVFSLLLYYKDKIGKIELEQKFIRKKGISERDSQSPVIPENDPAEAIEKYHSLFEKIQPIVENDYFKQTDFTISKLASLLNTNNVYISKAIKLNGYTNFNHYLNTCRVNNVKKLIQENDLNRITLMYIYTASGFSNQSTFNRVFKQIEGITPSEYIEKILKK